MLPLPLMIAYAADTWMPSVVISYGGRRCQTTLNLTEKLNQHYLIAHPLLQHLRKHPLQRQTPPLVYYQLVLRKHNRKTYFTVGNVSMNSRFLQNEITCVRKEAVF
ncbi:hypothetical protein ATANTOWER_029564 [Ataeniobius toweri]|uniref:Secreted protein n=1 Tax=Ataeniobius toweri TaxID=208326 RepID=A0ABU7ADG6_9TELE|nr:hypothetical protein [Ataeniobius toweri]